MHPSGHLVDRQERRRSGIVVALVAIGIAAVVVLAVVIHNATADDPAPDRSAATLDFPAAFGGYARATDAVSARILARSTGDSQRRAGLKTVVYTDARRHRLLVSGASAHDAAATDQILSGVRPENLLSNNLVDLQVIGAQDQDPAPFTGAFRCGSGVYSATQHPSVCGWADDDTFGVVVDLSDPSAGIPVAALGTVTRTLRESAESR